MNCKIPPGYITREKIEDKLMIDGQIDVELNSQKCAISTIQCKVCL